MFSHIFPVFDFRSKQQITLKYSKNYHSSAILWNQNHLGYMSQYVGNRRCFLIYQKHLGCMCVIVEAICPVPLLFHVLPPPPPPMLISGDLSSPPPLIFVISYVVFHLNIKMHVLKYVDGLDFIYSGTLSDHTQMRIREEGRTQSFQNKASAHAHNYNGHNNDGTHHCGTLHLFFQINIIIT